MIYVNTGPQIHNPLVPVLRSAAEFNHAGYTITTPNGNLTGTPEMPFYGNPWVSNSTTNTDLIVQFPTLVIVNRISFFMNTTYVFSSFAVGGANVIAGPYTNIIGTITTPVAGFNTYTTNNYTPYTYIQFFGNGSIPLGNVGFNYFQYFGIIT